MDELYIPALILHIVAGGLALLAGAINLMRKKGDGTHKTIGKVFVISMLASCLAAIFLSLLKGNIFLFLIGFFTLYLIGTGMRYLKTTRRRVKANRVSTSDWFMTFLLGIFSLALYYLSVTFFIRGQLFGLVLLSFAALSSFMVYQDYIVLNGKSTAQNFGLLMHIQRMSGAFIASLTAFIVVNVNFLPGVITWIFPSLLVVPFIVMWTKKYRKEKKSKEVKLEFE